MSPTETKRAFEQVMRDTMGLSRGDVKRASAAIPDWVWSSSDAELEARMADEESLAERLAGLARLLR